MTPLQRALYRTSLVVIALAASAGIALLLLNEPQPEGVRLATEPATDTTPLPTPTATTLGAPRLTNINTASAPELEDLPRIGEVLAQRIVDYRTEYGRFMRPDHIMAVRGIGPATYEAVRELITVGAP